VPVSAAQMSCVHMMGHTTFVLNCYGFSGHTSSTFVLSTTDIVLYFVLCSLGELLSRCSSEFYMDLYCCSEVGC